MKKNNIKKIFQFINFLLLRIFGFFISFLPSRVIHYLGAFAGIIFYYCHASFRKKTLTNLSIAYGESRSEQEKKALAKKSFQNLSITCLEFFRMKSSKKKLSKIVTLEGSEEVLQLMKRGQGIIFLTGHQANWEIPFLAMTQYFPGIAIGKPIKNSWLNQWILSIREMNGGKIVLPKNAIRQCMKALKTGKFIGIVGDQAVPESSYSYPLFGKRAWTTSAPALLSYRTNSPIVVVTTKRVGTRYSVQGSSPIWPDLSKSFDEEVVRLMDQAMFYFEKSIKECPEQWLWQHDRWKQQEIDHIKRKFRFGFILIILPPSEKYFSLLPLFKDLYPRSFVTLFIPEGTQAPNLDFDVVSYKNTSDLFIRDWKYQLVFDFVDSIKLRKHFRKLGAFQTLNVHSLKKISGVEEENLEKIVKHALIKKECL